MKFTLNDSQVRALAAAQLASQMQNTGNTDILKLHSWFDEVGVAPTFMSKGARNGYYVYSAAQLAEIGKMAIHELPEIDL